MPEAAMHKDHFFEAGKDDVRRSWQVAAMEPEPVTEAVGQPPDEHFRLRVSLPNE
jgi:hypothetical protein